VDPFTIVVFAGLAGLVLFIVLLGKFNENSPLDQMGLRTPREIIESREALEAEDLEQMLEAHNARRRKRGEPEVTAEDVEMRVVREQNEQRRRRDAYLADRELDELLEATNAQRRARGLPERTREEALREFGGAGADAD
jgi:hypothetical protein